MVVLFIADRIISSLDSIRKQPFWAVALAEMMRDEWCSSHKSAKVSLQVLLKKIYLPGPMITGLFCYWANKHAGHCDIIEFATSCLACA